MIERRSNFTLRNESDCKSVFFIRALSNISNLIDRRIIAQRISANILASDFDSLASSAIAQTGLGVESGHANLPLVFA